MDDSERDLLSLSVCENTLHTYIDDVWGKHFLNPQMIIFLSPIGASFYWGVLMDSCHSNISPDALSKQQ